MKIKLVTIIIVLLLVIPLISAEKTIYLQSKEFKPDKKIDVNITKVQLVQAKKVQSPLMRIKSIVKSSKSEQIQDTNQEVAIAKKKHIIIQLNYIPTEKDKKELAKRGVFLLDYIPEYTWVASVNEEIIPDLETDKTIEYIGDLTKEVKMLHSLKENVQVEKSKSLILETIRLKGKFFPDTSTDEMNSILSKYSTAYMLKENYFEINISKTDVEKLASEDDVKFVSDLFLLPRTQNNIARQIISVDTIQAHPYNLTGAGVVAAEWDGGWVGNHADFGSRITIGDSGGSINDHSTHVAGTMLGAGINNSLYKGMAPNATLISYTWATILSEFNTEYNSAINTYDAVVSQNSWGYAPNIITQQNCIDILGGYYEDDIWTDNATRGSFGKKITIVFAAGNERSTSSDYCGSIGYTYNTTIPPATAKNTITVGAVDDNNNMASFSSWGPTDDGRIKPDVVANGVSVASTVPTDSYVYSDGTSMAAPGVSGAAILLYEHYKNLHSGQNPDSELVKNIFIHTAKDLGNTGPDFQFGYGLVNATRAVEYISNDINKTLFFLQNITTTGENKTYQFELPEGKSELKITLVWNDFPGAELAAKELVNDLDLIVKNSTGQRMYPWTLDASNPSNAAVQNSEDHINNVEQVYVQNPDAGVWTIIINGSVIPNGPQEFSLITSTNDEAAPILNVTSPQDNTTYNDIRVNLNYTVSDNNLDSCWFTNTTGQNETLANCGNKTITGLLVGNYSITIYANDTYGNTILENINFTIYNTPPNITSYHPNSTNVIMNESQIQLFNHTSTDADGDNLTYQWLLNESLQSSNSYWSYTADYFSQGEWNVTLIVTDTKNKTATHYWNLTIVDVNTSTINYSFLTNDSWYLISVPVQTINHSIASIFSNISSSYQVWAWNGTGWDWFVSNYPVEANTINNISLDKGYWFRATSTGGFQTTGIVSSSRKISLVADWNLIGYPKITNSTISSITANLTGDYQVWSWDNGWKWFVSTYPSEANTLTTFETGQGYWIKPTIAQNLTIS